MRAEINIVEIIKTAVLAGEKIMDVYGSEDFQVEKKGDQSPLTVADKYSNDLISQKLKSSYPDIPVISEEEAPENYDERKNWEYLWIVDPLDGTKEFIKRNGEFTVNIAFVHKDKPVLGVIYAPVLDIVYFSTVDLGAFKLEGVSAISLENEEELVNQSLKLPIRDDREQKCVVASRSHLSKETEQYINGLKEEFGVVKIVSAGSSLKLCLVAEGKADVYPRFAPTMEWDTAAGQAIVEHAGGKVVQADANDEAVVYNKENLLNPWFIAKATSIED